MRWIVFVLFASLFVASPAYADCSCTLSDEAGNEESREPEGASGINSVGECGLACQDLANESGMNYVSACSEDECSTPGLEQELQEEAARDQAREEAIAQYQAFKANGQCNCFCGDKTSGAQVVTGSFKTNQECEDACPAAKDFVVCAKDLSAAPVSNPLCYTQADCTASEGVWGEEQPLECEVNTHYCYPQPEPIELNIAIGNTTQVFDIGSYINVVYTYALGAAAIIATVMVMIAGAQYIVGSRGGSTEAVSKAKDRIRNALIGLVLILGAYTILATVNPYLVRFETLRLPKIKPSLFIEGSCEDYVALGYTVSAETSGAVACGNKGILTEDPNGVTTVGECIYESCTGSGLQNSQCADFGGKYQCMVCGQGSVATFVDNGFTPSTGSCSALTMTNQQAGQKYECTYTTDASVAQSFADDFAWAAVTGWIPIYGTYATIQAYIAASESASVKWNGACVEIQLNCNSINTCRDYDSVQIIVNDAEGNPYNAAALDDMEAELQTICSANPCADPSKPSLKDGCKNVDAGSVPTSLGVGWNDCVSAGPDPFEDVNIYEGM